MFLVLCLARSAYEEDRERYRVTDSGIVVVPRAKNVIKD